MRQCAIQSCAQTNDSPVTDEEEAIASESGCFLLLTLVEAPSFWDVVEVSPVMSGAPKTMSNGQECRSLFSSMKPGHLRDKIVLDTSWGMVIMVLTVYRNQGPTGMEFSLVLFCECNTFCTSYKQGVHPLQQTWKWSSPPTSMRTLEGGYSSLEDVKPNGRDASVSLLFPPVSPRRKPDHPCVHMLAWPDNE